MRFVLDASVSLAWFTDDPVPILAVRAKQYLESGASALVPSLWHLEMANGFILAERRRALTPDFIEDCLVDVEKLLKSVIEHSSAVLTVRQAYAAGHPLGLTSYDAVYLETARREHVALATIDRALARAALKAGVPLLE